MSELLSFDPVTNEVLGRVRCASAQEVERRAEVARASQKSWAALGFEGRSSLLARAGDLVSERGEALGLLVHREMGKPIAEAQGEAAYVAKLFKTDLAEMREAFRAEVRESESARSTIYRDAHGVVACISPWNFPLLMPHTQLLPALAAGNTVLFKPSERTPLCGQAYADALLEVLPNGVLQVLHGEADVGRALVKAEVDLVVFTGSRLAGVHILAQASRTLKRVILELGGKDPMLVLAGADLDRAARFAAKNSFGNSGQVCVSTERIYVQSDLHDAFVQKLIDAASAMMLGPMVDARQKAQVLDQLKQAEVEGAFVAYRGEQNEGNFLAPVVLTEVRHTMAIAREETFGPVACVIRVHDESEAIRFANDSPYGLGAIVYAETEVARRVGRQLLSGMIGINRGLHGAGGTPWVGARQSGYGFHSGIEGHRQFTQLRVIHEGLEG